jgi:hypothetical protein
MVQPEADWKSVVDQYKLVYYCYNGKLKKSGFSITKPFNGTRASAKNMSVLYDMKISLLAKFPLPTVYTPDERRYDEHLRRICLWLVEKHMVLLVLQEFETEQIRFQSADEVASDQKVKV